MEGKIRNLYADEIECRVGSIGDKGLSLLLYKDARIDQLILDECFGNMGWQRTHMLVGEQLYCDVSIRDTNTGEWIHKQDVGTESYTEAAKGAASDSFKRACVNIGIGRELYTAPFIWVSADKTDIKYDGKKYVSKDRFKVSEISYDEKRNIISLQIINQKGELVYAFNKIEKKPEAKGRELSKVQQFRLKCEMERTGVGEEDILRRYKLSNLSTMPEETYERLMTALEKTKDLAA